MNFIFIRLNNLKKFLALSLALAKAEFKLRNEGSYLGIFWYLLNPILTFSLLLLIFSKQLGSEITDYPLYLLTGIVTFNLFSQITTQATKVIKTNRWLIKSVKFPPESLVSGVTLTGLFSHLFEVFLLFILAMAFQNNLTGFIFYPFLLLLFCIFIYGLSLILAALSVHFADLENIWIFFSRLVWFATPIFYTIDHQTILFKLNLFNPLYYFITLFRQVIIYNQIPASFLAAGAISYTLISLVIGQIIFNRLKPKFAEKI
ncbi:MAG: ABC transporter permease [Patescibacteria group bacterium]|jgi:ABC-type polysaccharide/polyol phosphate export permease